MEAFCLSNTEKDLIRDRMVNMVMRIIVRYLSAFEDIKETPEQHIPHMYTEESNAKSTLFNIGIVPENPSSIAGVIKILERLHDYVPRRGNELHNILTWGDGLSCERHVDSQNARANDENPLERLMGLEPAPQEFHKRMLLLQNTMDRLFDGKSATDKGTLFYLKNVFNQKSVSKNVSDSFNYVSDFLKFATEGYVILFAMDELGLSSIDCQLQESDKSDLVEILENVSRDIVKRIWSDTQISPTEHTDTTQYDYCFCKQDLEDEDVTMIECDNEECPEGGWFHLECVGLEEDKLPCGQWFCCDSCLKAQSSYCICKQDIRNEPMVECCFRKCNKGVWFHAKCMKIPRSKLPSDDDIWYCSVECRKHDKIIVKSGQEGIKDRKYEYTKVLLWRGLNDLIRRDAVRENDGPMMTLYWKADLVTFFKGNHNKYFILGHRLIAGINGWLPERLRQYLIWNRTVNLRGGRGSNDEIDLVNEFLNREFKDSIRAMGSQTTNNTLKRHGKLAGGVGKVLDSVYGGMFGDEGEKQGKRKEDQRIDDMKLFVELLQGERLTRCIRGRCHKAFKKSDSKMYVNINPEKFFSRIDRLNKKLDKGRRVVV